MSFLGIGLPSLGAYRMLPIDHPDRKLVGGCAGAYWWHSLEDTLDKADANVLADDTGVYLALIARMCSPETLPYDFVPAAHDFAEHLQPLHDLAGSSLELTTTLQAAHDFEAEAIRLRATHTPDNAILNEGFKRLSRIVNPVLYTTSGPYDMDPALQRPLLPGLVPARELNELEPESDAYHFLLTYLRRQCNRTEDALVEATETARRLVS
jgi:hypothetical protein